MWRGSGYLYPATILIILLLGGAIQPISAQFIGSPPQVTWGGPNVDIGEDVEIVGDSIYLAGETMSFGDYLHDVFIVKLGMDGSFQWGRVWRSIDDVAHEIVKDMEFVDGYLYVVGEITSFPSKGFILVVDPTGDLPCEFVFTSEDDIVFNTIEADPRGGILIGGRYGSDPLLLRFDSCSVLEIYTFPSTSEIVRRQSIIDMAIYNNTIYALVNVETTSFDVDVGVYMIGLDGSIQGNIVFNFTNIFESGVGLAVDNMGSVVATGYASIDGVWKIFLLKLNSVLTMEWGQLIAVGPYAEPSDIEIDLVGNIYVAGKYSPDNIKTNMLLIELMPNGTLYFRLGIEPSTGSSAAGDVEVIVEEVGVSAVKYVFGDTEGTLDYIVPDVSIDLASPQTYTLALTKATPPPPSEGANTQYLFIDGTINNIQVVDSALVRISQPHISEFTPYLALITIIGATAALAYIARRFNGGSGEKWLIKG